MKTDWLVKDQRLTPPFDEWPKWAVKFDMYLSDRIAYLCHEETTTDDYTIDNTSIVKEIEQIRDRFAFYMEKIAAQHADLQKIRKGCI